MALLRSPPPSLVIFFVLAVISTAQSSEPRRLDESLDQSKCGGCPCGNPCPAAYSPPPPPPPKKSTPPTSGSYCPPPPSPPSSFIYMTGPPGNLYPVDQTYNGAARAHGVFVGGAAVALLNLFLLYQF